ncbi:MAG: cyclic nucleotide-binding domain-containing protein [Pseudomonadota bacterium]
MSLKQEVEVLRKIPLFAKVDSAKLKLLAFTSERLTFEAGQTLFLQGEAGDAAYIVLEGEAEVKINTAKGPVVVARIGVNSIVGEIAILCDVPRTATVAAKSKLVTLRIGKDTFLNLIVEAPQMAVEIMRELARRLERTNEQLRQAMSRPGTS